MKIILETATGLVIYAGETLTLTEFGTSNGNWLDNYSTTDNCTMVEDVELPADWLGGSYIYLDGEWARTSDGEAVAAARLAGGRNTAWSQIKTHRDLLSEAGGYSVTVGGETKWFHSDAKSKTQQLGLLIAGAAVPPVPWKTMDGSFVTMSQAWAAAIFAAAAAQDIAIFGAAEAHRAAMMAAEDPLAYDWRSTGWPAVYGGA